MNQKIQKMFQIVAILLVIVALSMVGFLVYSKLIENNETSNVYATTITIIDNQSSGDIVIDEEILSQSVGIMEDKEEDIIELYNKFKAINEDTVAYLRIRNSNMNFPVVQSNTVCSTHHVVDNCYYLYRDIYKRSAVNENAIQFVEANNVIGNTIKDFDQNTVIYGHTWSNSEKNGKAARIGDPVDKQFGQLVSYTDMEWLKSHSVVELTTGVEKTYWIPQFVVYTDCIKTTYPNGFNFIKRTLNNSDIQKLYDRSVIVNPDTVDVDTDKFLLLSTCNYKYGSSKINRFIVVFKYIEADNYYDALEISKTITYEVHENVVDW